MEVLLTRYRIITDRGDGLTPGEYIETYWDTVAEAIVVYQKSSPSDPTPTLRVSGPNLGLIGLRGRSDSYDTFLEIPAYDVQVGGNIIAYSFCDGPTLNTFTYDPDFPYTNRIEQENNFSCSSIVCDIDIESFSITEASDSVTADGSISGIATTNNGVIRWGLDPAFEYSSGQLSGTFTGLLAGDYTLVAKDELGCIAQVNVTVGVPINYDVKYRLEFTDVKGFDTLVEIEERGYTGDVIEVCGSGAAVNLRANTEGELNRFTRIIPTEFRLGLLSESNFFFNDLFTQDERKYKIKYYVNFGSGYEIKWVGFVIAQNYRESYVAPPYPIQIVATDGLADMAEYDFEDSSGNRFKDDIITLRSVVECLKKTDLNLNILFGINKYEVDMDNGVDDDPLNQCSFEPELFYQSEDSGKCAFVLDEVLKPFGARLIQRNGKWWIYCIEQSVITVPYREFDYQGNYIGNGSVLDVKTITPNGQLQFRNASQTLEIVPAYGVFDFVHQLQKRESLVKSFSFEEDDIINGPLGQVLIDGWNVDISKDAGATSGIKEIKSFLGNWSFFYKRGVDNDLHTISNYVTLTSIGGEIEYSSTDSIQFGFDFAAILKTRDSRRVPYYLRIEWMLKVGDYYYNDAAEDGWTTDEAFKYNNIYFQDYNDPRTFKKVFELRSVDELTLESFNIEFVFHRQNHVDFIEDDPDTHDQLKALPTVALTYGSFAKGTLPELSATTDNIVSYKLTGDVDNPEAIFPDDYDSVDNRKVWIFEQTNYSRGGDRTVEYFYLDNIILLHLPGGVDPPKTNEYQLVNNRNLKVNFDETFQLADVDLDINNSERTYRNFFKLLDGTPTQTWARTWRSGDGKLLDLLLSEYRSQYGAGTYKLTGDFDVNSDIVPSTILSEVFDNGKKYMFMGYSLNGFENSITFDVSELIDVTEEDGPGIDAGFTTGFSLGFKS